MKVYIGTTEISLTQKDFVAQGGEGTIYAQGGVVYKVFEPGKTVPVDKIRELQTISDPHVIVPEQLLTDKKGSVIGYTMPHLKDTHVLCELFTKAFRLRRSITPDMNVDLVRKLQTIVDHIHSKNILIVDLNELNFLVDQNLREVYAIDTNSYQTPHFPATAIMESIRDRHSSRFSEKTDWFSFAIVSFQLMIGIHPYKGNHPAYADLDARMKHNVSVLNKDVKYPKGVCQPFDVIPQVYLQWYHKVLDAGERLHPPADLHDTIVITKRTRVSVPSGTHVAFREIRRAPEPIVYAHAGFAYYTNMVPLGDRVARLEDGFLHFVDGVFGTAVDHLLAYDGRVYVVNKDKVIEVMGTLIGGKWVYSPRVVGTILPQASTIYDGVIIQRIFGTHFASVFPASGQCQQITLRELDGKRVINAKFDNHVLMVVTIEPSGSYDRFVFSFSKMFESHEVSITNNVPTSDINFVQLDTGVCLLLEDTKLTLFNKHSFKEVDDPALQGMTLWRNGAQAQASKDEVLYEIKLK